MISRHSTPVKLELHLEADDQRTICRHGHGGPGRAGLVASVRGPGGGYRLGAPAGDITAAAIIEAMDEDIDATQCRGDGSCLGGAACLTHHLWEDLNRTTRKFLEGVTLAGMVEAHAARHGKQVVSAVIPVRKHA